MTCKRYEESPEQRAKRRARENARRKRKRERLRAERAAQLGNTASKTSAVYRQIYFGVMPEMTKPQLREMIAQAVRNTAAMGTPA